MIGIYKITNTINGKVYIGQAQDIEKRWKDHIKDSEKGNQVIYRAMRKYGVENFSFEVVEECSIEELDEKEIYYIEEYNSYIHAENSNGYNMTLGGGGVRGYKLSKEARDKISRVHKGKVASQELREIRSRNSRGENNPNYGKHWSNEIKEKIRQGNRGRKHTEEERLKISKANSRGNHHKAKKVMCEDLEFKCAKDCAEYYGVKYGTMKSWLNGRNKIPLHFKEKGLKYKDTKGENTEC